MRAPTCYGPRSADSTDGRYALLLEGHIAPSAGGRPGGCAAPLTGGRPGGCAAPLTGGRPEGCTAPLISGRPRGRTASSADWLVHLRAGLRCGALAGFVMLVSALGLTGGADFAFAASATAPPHSGLEGGQGRSYGPDIEKRSGNNIPQTSLPMDAYGNPITGEIQEAAPRQRPSAGAYGGYGKQQKAPSRPLPDVPAKPKWGFD